MRTNSWAPAAGLFLLLAGEAARADEQERLRGLVEEAIKAKGGEARLTELQAAVWKSRGAGPERTTRATLYGQLPDKFRLESERTAGGKTVRFVKVINGDRGWAVEGGRVRAMTAQELAQAKATFYHKQLDTTLLPLRDEGVKLAGLGESQVGDRQAVGVAVSRAGFPDVRLYFDKKTKMLLKSEMGVREGAGGKESLVEYHYSDYQDFGGMKLARRTQRVVDGKPFGQVDITEFTPKKSLPSHYFLPPTGGGDKAEQP
jgi:hypothetical protein